MDSMFNQLQSLHVRNSCTEELFAVARSVTPDFSYCFIIVKSTFFLNLFVFLSYIKASDFDVARSPFYIFCRCVPALCQISVGLFLYLPLFSSSTKASVRGCNMNLKRVTTLTPCSPCFSPPPTEHKQAPGHLIGQGGHR